MKVTFETLMRVADLRHVASTDEARLPLAGVQIRFDDDGVWAAASDSYAAARLRIDAREGGVVPFVGLLHPGDLAAAAAAFQARASDPPEAATITVTVTVDETLELVLDPSQEQALFETELAELASYTIRRIDIGDVAAPPIDHLFDERHPNLAGTQVWFSMDRLTALWKTSGQARVPKKDRVGIQVTVHAERSPIHITLPTHSNRHRWEGLLMPIAGVRPDIEAV